MMKTILILIKRNIKLFFKDKGLFLTSLITPLILLVLYISFLANVYRNTFIGVFSEWITVPDNLIDSLVASQLISSLIAVSCITVAFCSNFLMVQDKANGTIKDLKITPTKSSALSISYYIATIISTLLICYVALTICLIYVAVVGWFYSIVDVLLLILDVTLLVLFGTALSSVINFFLSSQGQISAVGTIVSSGYGFICGAYMPISSFSVGLQNVIAFLPGTYGTSLVREHATSAILKEFEHLNLPVEVINGLKDSLDYNLFFLGHQVESFVKYLIIISTIVVLIGVYILLNFLKKKTYK